MKWFGAFVYDSYTEDVRPINYTNVEEHGKKWYLELDHNLPAGSKLGGRYEDVWVIVEVDDED